MDADSYTIRVLNQSSQQGSFAILQIPVGQKKPDLWSMVWLAHPAAPETSVTFEWEANYEFVWREPPPESGPDEARISAGEIVPAGSHTAITLTKSDGAYRFVDPGQADQQGVVQIKTDKTVVEGEVLIGYGMAGHAIGLEPARPDRVGTFDMGSHYLITFGAFEAGEVVSETDLTNVGMLDFPANVRTLSVLYAGPGRWTVTQA